MRWDDHLKLWIGYVRLDSGTQNRRRTGRTTSKDFLTWTKAEQVFEGQHGCKIVSFSICVLSVSLTQKYHYFRRDLCAAASSSPHPPTLSKCESDERALLLADTLEPWREPSWRPGLYLAMGSFYATPTPTGVSAATVC